MERIDVNNNTLLNIQQSELIEKHFPPFSEKRKLLREKWNKLNSYVNIHISWENYLLHSAVKEEINVNIPLPF